MKAEDWHGQVVDELRGEIDRLRAELKREKEKVRCPDCRGSGESDISYHCNTCDGTGRVDP